MEEKKRTEMSLERAKVGVEEESRRRQSLAKEGNGERGDVPKGWEEEYSMARLAEEGGSPRARQEIAEMGFDRVALRVNGRNSSGLTPSQRMSLLRGRSEMFAEMYDALFDDDDGAADGDRRGSQRSRRSFDLGSRRNSQEFRRNSEEFFQRGTLPSLTESEENTTSTTATTTRSIQEQRRLVQDFRNMVLEELYLSEAIYRSMLDVHEDESENVHPHVEEEEGEEEEGSRSRASRRRGDRVVYPSEEDAVSQELESVGRMIVLLKCMADALGEAGGLGDGQKLLVPLRAEVSVFCEPGSGRARGCGDTGVALAAAGFGSGASFDLGRFPRALSCVTFGNLAWDPAAHGGLLRLHHKETGRVADVVPEIGTVVLFRPDLVDTEVLPIGDRWRTSLSLAMHTVGSRLDPDEP